jgi:hypothetical protein
MTAQVTSPTSLLLSMIITVELMVPLMSIALVLPADKTSAEHTRTNKVIVCERFIAGFLSEQNS